MKTIPHCIIHPIQSLFGKSRRFGVAACALAILVATGATAQAQRPTPLPVPPSASNRPSNDRPFKIINETGTLEGDFFEGAGNATHLGHLTVEGVSTDRFFDETTGIYTAVITGVFTAANGDKLNVVSQVWIDFNLFPFIQYSEGILMGGTGRFSNATGKVSQAVLVNFEFTDSGFNFDKGTWESISGEGSIRY